MMGGPFAEYEAWERRERRRRRMLAAIAWGVIILAGIASWMIVWTVVIFVIGVFG